MGFFTFALLKLDKMKYSTTPINQWVKEERPREKLADKGASHLTDAEILAILLGTGSGKKSAIDLARNILLAAANDLNELSRLPISELTKISGIGPAKAITIQAALELGRRKRNTPPQMKRKISSSKDVFEHFQAILGDLPHEEFWIMNLNRSNQVLSTRKISEGGWHSTVVDPKKVFSRALEEKASSLILAHNHPSGNVSPSIEDKKITNKLRRSGIDLEMPILDHLIIASHGYFSFADEGIFGVE
ncbi:MAG: DNA repair protein RadC [Flavobacteriales bacterium]